MFEKEITVIFGRSISVQMCLEQKENARVKLYMLNV